MDKNDKNDLIRAALEGFQTWARNESERSAKRAQQFEEDRKARAERRAKEAQKREEEKRQREEQWERERPERERKAKEEADRRYMERLRMEQEQRRKEREKQLEPFLEARKRLKYGDLKEIGKRLGLKATTLSKAFGEANNGSRNDWRILAEAKRIIEEREGL